MPKQKEKTVIQFTLEIRLKTLIPSFIDYKGRITELLIDKLKNADKFRIMEDRIDLTSNNNLLSYFVTMRNFGLQIENSNSWNDFISSSESFLSTLESIKEYRPKDYIRIGTKAQLLIHKKGEGFESIKSYFDKKLISLTNMENALNAKLGDVGFPLNFESKDGNFNLIVGPMRRKQAFEDYFLKRGIGYENILPDTGIFFSIDYFNIDPSVKSFSALKAKVLSNINVSKEKYQLFLSWLQS